MCVVATSFLTCLNERVRRGTKGKEGMKRCGGNEQNNQ